MPKKSGQAPFTFSLCEDFSTVPERAQPFEAALHGGFAVDPKPGGSIYYGMPGCGLMRVNADLSGQEIIELPTDLTPINFHSTKIIEFDGKQRLVMPANGDAMVVVLSMDGNVDFRLSRPEFDEYRDEEVKFNPTDTAFADNTLFVADGYGANYISAVDIRKQEWTRTFAGKTTDPHAPGLFGTAHGLATAPDGHHLSVADRPHSRFQLLGFDGHFHSSHAIPDGSKPCGIDFQDVDGRAYALVGSLDDPQEGRPAPIYVLDAQTYAVVSTVRPKEDLGVDLADHIHNAVWYQHAGQVYLICQAWNPGRYFVLARES
jgi:hypothetical protein